MAKKIIMLTSIILMIVMSINLLSYKMYAADSLDSIMQGADDFRKSGSSSVMQNADDNRGQGESGSTGEKLVDEADLKETSDFIYNVLLAIAMVVAVIVGMIIGIQFMTGSVEEKAKIKEALMPYVAGCVVVFGAFGIWKLAIMVLSTW